MRTLIDTNKLLDKMTQAWQKGVIHTDDMHTLFRLIDEIEPEDRWIPVTERLPEDGQCCLVTVTMCFDNREVNALATYYDENDDGNGYWILDHDIDYLDVLAWLPVPEPYREETHTAQDVQCRKVREILTALGFADNYTPSLYEYISRVGEMMEDSHD